MAVPKSRGYELCKMFSKWYKHNFFSSVVLIFFKQINVVENTSSKKNLEKTPGVLVQIKKTLSEQNMLIFRKKKMFIFQENCVWKTL